MRNNFAKMQKKIAHVNDRIASALQGKVSTTHEKLKIKMAETNVADFLEADV